MMIAILMTWAIWNIRNDFIFNNMKPSVEAVKFSFKKEIIKLLSLRAKAKYSTIFD